MRTLNRDSNCHRGNFQDECNRFAQIFRPTTPLATWITANIWSRKKIKHEAPDRASIRTDTNVYNELAIPVIKIGPRNEEEIDIDVMVIAAKLYALIAWDICRGRGAKVKTR